MSKLKKFKSRFKRFVLVLPLISAILFSVIPISSSAFYTFGENKLCEYADEFNTDSRGLIYAQNFLPSEDYFHLQFYWYKSSSSKYYIVSIYVPFIEEFSVNDNNPVYTVDFSKSNPFYYCSNGVEINSTGQVVTKEETIYKTPDYLYGIEYNVQTRVAKLFTNSSKTSSITTYGETCLTVDSSVFNTDPNQLNVDVSFSPPLRGDVSREFEYNGILQKYTYFNMTITNNSSKPIIYFMYIDSFDSSNPIVDNDGNWHNDFGHWSYPSEGVSFQFIKKEWVYSRNMDTQSSFSGTTADRWKKYYKPTFYHYLAAGDSLTQTFNWSQINIVANTNYYCLVGAQLTELDCGSDISNYDSDALNSEYKDFPITGFSPVYHSIFSLSDLSDIPYNPNDSSNGLIPNSDYRIEDSRYTMQFDASESMDGFLDYNSGDLYSDQNSWFNNKDVSSRPTVSGSGSFSFFSLIGGISNVYDFLRYSLSILPSEVYMIILSSIFIVIFIGIIKRLG